MRPTKERIAVPASPRPLGLTTSVVWVCCRDQWRHRAGAGGGISEAALEGLTQPTASSVSKHRHSPTDHRSTYRSWARPASAPRRQQRAGRGGGGGGGGRRGSFGGGSVESWVADPWEHDGAADGVGGQRARRLSGGSGASGAASAASDMLLEEVDARLAQLEVCGRHALPPAPSGANKKPFPRGAPMQHLAPLTVHPVA